MKTQFKQLTDRSADLSCSYKVYGLYESFDTDLPRYIGCTKNMPNRLSGHLQWRRTPQHQPLTAWVSHHRKSDPEFQPNIELIAEFTSRKIALQYETYLIDQYYDYILNSLPVWYNEYNQHHYTRSINQYMIENKQPYNDLYLHPFDTAHTLNIWDELTRLKN
jgi:hypothetical protein